MCKRPGPIDVEIHLTFAEDFCELREMLALVDDLVDLVPEWSRPEAEDIQDRLLDYARKTIDANARPKTTK